MAGNKHIRKDEQINKILNFVSDSGATPLLRAARNGHDKLVKMLLEIEGTEINQADNEGATPLLVAAQNGHDKVVEILLREGGIQVNKPWKDGATPLFIAAQKGHEKVVKILLEEENIQVNKARKDGCSPLEKALQKSHLEVARLLKDKLTKPLNDTHTCIVCLTRKPDVVLVPCPSEKFGQKSGLVNETSYHLKVDYH